MESDGLISALVLDGKGAARRLDWEGVRAWTPSDGPLWLHLHREGAESRRWLEDWSGIDPLTTGALLTSASRPRASSIDDGLLLILRGANLNPDADPDDLISLRIWAEPARLVSLRREHFQTVEAISEQLAVGKGPKSIGELIVCVIAGLTDRIVPLVNELDEQLSAIEDEVANPQAESNRAELIERRREIIALYRYLSPQRQALLELAESASSLIDKKQRRTLREAAARLERCLSDLDAARARASVIQDEIVTQQSETVNRRVYTLTVVAVIFLPLTLISGMLGMNVGGVPLAESSGGFIAVTIALAAMGVVIYLLLRVLRWI